MNKYAKAGDPMQARHAQPERELALAAVQAIPERGVVSVGELAHRIGVDKLVLIRWFREDVSFARVIESKMLT
jgi:hypothetical protein